MFFLLRRSHSGVCIINTLADNKLDNKLFKIRLIRLGFSFQKLNFPVFELTTYWFPVRSHKHYTTESTVMLDWFHLNSPNSTNSSNLIQNRKNTNVFTGVCHQFTGGSASSRHASLVTWPKGSLPSEGVCIVNRYKFGKHKKKFEFWLITKHSQTSLWSLIDCSVIRNCIHKFVLKSFEITKFTYLCEMNFNNTQRYQNSSYSSNDLVIFTEFKRNLVLFRGNCFHCDVSSTAVHYHGNWMITFDPFARNRSWLDCAALSTLRRLTLRLSLIRWYADYYAICCSLQMCHNLLIHC